MGLRRQLVLQTACLLLLHLPCSTFSTFDCSQGESTVFALRDDGAGVYDIAGLLPNATWQRLFQLDVGAGQVNACEVNPQDSILYCLITYSDGVFVARVAENRTELVARLPSGTSVRSAAFRSDGTLYVAGNTTISSLEGLASISEPNVTDRTWSANVSHGIPPTAVGGIVVYMEDTSTYVASMVPSGFLRWHEGSGFQSFTVSGAPVGTYSMAWQFGSRLLFATESAMVEVFLDSLDFTAMTVLARGVLALDFQSLLGGISCSSVPPSLPYSCSAVPNVALLPETALQDCGSDPLNGSTCPFNCTNGLSRAGQLTCVNGSWVVDGADPPRCIPPCQNLPGEEDVRTRTTLIGYEFGYWASPTVSSTSTTTTLPCDRTQAQMCLEAVISITDIELFCVALPAAITCLRDASCCLDAEQPIEGSINSCLDAGLQVENACGKQLDLDETCDADSAAANCLAGVPETMNSNESCLELARAPLCLFSKSCCPLLSNIANLEAQVSTCASLGVHVENPCQEEELPIANEGAIFRESCRSPRVPADDSVSEEDYVCKDGSFSILGASNLTCVDLPCHLSSHPDGAYDCVLDGQPGPLQLIEDVEGEGYLVPLGAACSLRCDADYQQPVPPVEYRCAYAERAYPDIIYLSELVSSSAVPRMVERSLSGSLQPLVTSQVCMDINCTLPTLDDPLQPNILSINCTGISYNSTCAPVCAAGYQSDGHELRCAADGQFQGFLRCLPLPCSGEPLWSPGELKDPACAGRPHGAVCDIRCSPGYDPDPEATHYVCEASEWRIENGKSTPCVEKSCPEAPQIRNALPSSLLTCAGQPGGFKCPVECIEGYSFTGSVTCTMGSYVVDALGCVRDSVATMPTTVLGADLTVVSAATNNSDDKSIAVVSMRSSLVLDPTLSPEDLGSHVAVDLLATNRSSPLNATLAVWSAALSSDLLPIAAITAAVSAGLAVGAPVAAFSALAELALGSLSVNESIAGITHVLMSSVNDTARLTSILGAALDAVSSTALMQSMPDSVGSRRLATDTAASMGDTVAETANSIGGQLPTQETSVELSRIHDGALLAGKSLLFADTAVAYAQTRWLGLPLPQLSTARQGLANVIRQAAEGAYEAGLSIASRSRSLLDVAQQMGNTLGDLHPDRGAAAAHSLGLEFGLSPIEALQLAAATAFHLHVGRCADTAFRCLPWRLIAIRDSGRSMANLLRWRSGPHALEAGHMALAAAAAAENSLSGLEADLEAKLAAAAGAMSVFGLTEQDMSLHAPTLAGADVPIDAARSAWMLGMSEKADRVLQVLQGTTETGAALAIRLGEDLMSEVSPWEGRLAVEWAMSTGGNSQRSSRSVAAMSAALLAGATAGDLLGALNSANVVPVQRRSPNSVAAAVAAALPSAEASARCAVSQAIAISFQLTTVEAARAGALATGFDMAQYSVVLQAVSEASDSPGSFSSDVAPVLGALNGTDMQQLSLAFAVFMGRFSWEGDLTTPLASALRATVGDEDPGLEHDTALLSPLAVCVGAELWELVAAVQMARDGTSLKHASMVLGQAAFLTSQAADSSIFQVASIQAAVKRAQRRRDEAAGMWTIGSQHLAVTPVAALSAWRALRDGNDTASLVQKVEQAVLNLTGGRDNETLASAAHFAAAYAGFSADDASQAVYQVAGSTGFPGLLAASWPAGVPVMSSLQNPSSSAVRATTAALALAMSDGTVESSSQCLNGAAGAVICEKPTWPSDTCALQLGLTENFTCNAFCASQSSTVLQTRCLDFAIAAASTCDASNSTVLPDPCGYAATLQDSSQMGICVCSGRQRANNHAASIAAGLVRISAEAQVMSLLGGIAYHVVAPWRVISAAALQLQAGATSAQIAEAVNVAANSEGAFSISGEQAAYAGHFLASSLGLNGSSSLAAAVEAASLRDPTGRLQHLTAVLAFRGVPAEEALNQTIAAMLSALPQDSTEALIQGVWWYQLFLEGAVRPWRLGDLRDAFEGVAPSQFALLDAAARTRAVLVAESGVTLGDAVVTIASATNHTGPEEVQHAAYAAALLAYLSTEEAAAAVAGAASALDADETSAAVRLLNYFLASGYNISQASAIVSTAGFGSQDADLQTAGSHFQELFPPRSVWQPALDQWKLPTGLPTGGSAVAIGKVHEPFLIQGLATVFQVTPAQVFLRSFSRRLSSRHLARRLSELPKCNIDFVIEIGASDDAVVLSQRVAEFAAGSSALYTQFEQSVQQELEGAGLEMPSCFRDGKVAVANVEVVDNFVLPESVWLADSDWSQCQDQCIAESIQTRSLICSTGNEFACNLSGTRPSTERPCENFENCAFEWACPLGGKASDMECHEQILLLVGIIVAGLLALWCCCCLAYRFARAFRPVAGQLKLMTPKGEAMKVNFYIVEESEVRVDKTRTTQTQDSSAASSALGRGWSHVSSRTSQKEVKSHVVWDVDVEKAKTMEFHEGKMTKLQKLAGANASQQEVLQRLPEVLDTTQQDEYRTKQMLREQEEEAIRRAETTADPEQGSPVAKIMSVKSGISASQMEAALGIGPYVKEERVEYWSATHCKWLAAFAESHGPHPSTGSICYEIKLAGSTQRRLHVPLENLRSPILMGEPVSAWSSKDRRWHLAEAGRAVTAVAYKVVAANLAKKDPVFDNLQPHFVWRRFEEGMPVEVYRNPTLGWVSAKVVRDAEMTDKPYEEAIDKGRPPNWFPVLVEYADSGMKEDVPAYLLRRECMSL
ncbi:unnamed protein product [Symbiodinium sp. CCMP2592]|nr:unnamed protein product [Symbiodinium sp. CCMP2592]